MARSFNPNPNVEVCIMKTFVRLFCLAVAFVAIGLSVTPLASAADAKTAAPPRSTAELSTDLDDLEAQLNHLEKNIGTYDERQRRSIYAKLLAMAENIRVGLAVHRNLLNQAIASTPKNTKKDTQGGVTNAVTGELARRQAELNRLDARLKALSARIAALNPDKPAGVGPRPGVGGGTTTTPAGGTRKK
jgi:hypothetical protein